MGIYDKCGQQFTTLRAPPPRYVCVSGDFAYKYIYNYGIHPKNIILHVLAVRLPKIGKVAAEAWAMDAPQPPWIHWPYKFRFMHIALAVASFKAATSCTLSQRVRNESS